MNKYKKNFGQIEIFQDLKAESHLFIHASLDQVYDDALSYELDDPLYLEFENFIEEFFMINKS